MSADLLPVLRQKFFSSNGVPLAGGKLYSYAAGTTTPKATYSDQAGVTPNANPVILDANGEAAVYINPEYYKFILKDSSDVVQWTVDNATLPQVTALASAFYRDVVYITNSDSPYTIASTHNGKLIVADTTSGAITINLPQISTVTMPFNIAILAKSSANAITINRAGTDTIFGATSKSITVAGVGTQMAADTDKSPNDWSTLDFGTVADGSITNAKLSSTIITGQTEDTNPDPTADYVMTFDGSASALKKIKLVRAHDLKTVSKTANYTATIDDDIILCSGSAFTVTLPAAASSTNKVLIIKKTDSSFTNIITIDGNASETIDGALTTTLNTQYESIRIACDGSNWNVIDRAIPFPWTDGGVITITGTTTNPTKGNTVVVDKLWYRRVGCNLEGRFEYRQSSATGSAAGTGDYVFKALPAGLTIDTTKCTAFATAIGTGAYLNSSIVGTGAVGIGGTNGLAGVSVYDTSNVRLLFQDAANAGAVGPTNYVITNATFEFQAAFSVPITGWNS